MKRSKSRKLAIALALATVPFLMGCGSNKQSNSIGSIPGAVVPGVPGAPGTCIPVNQQIPFSGNGVYFSTVNIRGGQIPNGQAVGQMFVGGAGGAGPFQRSGVDGTISMNIMPTNQAYPATGYPAPGYPAPTTYPAVYPTVSPGTPTTATLTGMLNISPATQADIAFQFGNQYGNTGWQAQPYPTYPTPGTFPMPVNPQVPCVSGIAIDGGHYYNTIYDAHVYLYLNNTTHGYILYF